jgi:hypothetical protein
MKHVMCAFSERSSSWRHSATTGEDGILPPRSRSPIHFIAEHYRIRNRVETRSSFNLARRVSCLD